MPTVDVSESQALQTNQDWWNERAPMHARSAFYDVDSIIAGEIRLRDYEREEVGSVVGQTLVHLQCHIGTETIGWARLGADAIGLDFSKNAIETARELARRSNVGARYEVGNVYDAPDILGRNIADVVYVNTGSLHYLPDIRRWGQTVHELLQPGGRLFVNEIHPVSAVLDDDADAPTFARDYFDEGPVEWDEPGSYADTNRPTTHDKHIVWDRPLSSVMGAVLESGLQITAFHERPGQEFQQFPFQIQDENGLWLAPAGYGIHPSTYSLTAIKPAAA